MVARLARKLERNPNDVNGWLLLGRSYIVLEQFPPGAALLSARGPPRGREERGSAGRGGRVPDDERRGGARWPRRAHHRAGAGARSEFGQGLFFGAAPPSAAASCRWRGRRFSKLLAMNPPEAIRPDPPATDRRHRRETGGQLQSATPGASVAATTANDSNAAVRVHIDSRTRTGEVSLRMQRRSSYLCAIPVGPVPPLAAKRLTSHFPQTVELRPSDSMCRGAPSPPGKKYRLSRELPVRAIPWQAVAIRSERSLISLAAMGWSTL